MTFHRDELEGSVHRIVDKTYADIAARDADTPYQIAENVDKTIRVNSPIAYFILVSIGPPVFESLGGSLNDEWTELLDTPSSITPNLNVQGNSAGTALEFGQNLTPSGNLTFTSEILTGQVNDISLNLTSSVAAFKLNTLSTAARDNLTAVQGMMIFNTDVNQVEDFNGSSWIGATGNDAWIELVDTPGAISPNLVVQGNAAGLALEFGQNLTLTGAPTFNSLAVTNGFTVGGTTFRVTPSVNLVEADAAFHVKPPTARGILMMPFGVAAGNTSELRFEELTTNGINYVGFKAPDLITADLVWTLPASDGSSGQHLTTDGSLILSWAFANFLQLSDTPSIYPGAGLVVQVNLADNGLEFGQNLTPTGTPTFGSTVINGNLTVDNSLLVVIAGSNLVEVGGLFVVTPFSAPAIELRPFGTSAGNTSEIQFFELVANGANFVGFKSADLLAANVIWTLPDADGAAGEQLTTNGSGILSWNTGGGDVDGPTGATDNAVARFDLATGKLIQNSTVLIDDLGKITTPAGGGLVVDVDTLIVDPTLDRVGIGNAAAPLTDLTIFQGSGGSNKGLTLAGQGLIGNSNTDGASIYVGVNAASNLQLIFCAFSQQGLVTENCFRLIMDIDVPNMGGVTGNLGQRRSISIGDDTFGHLGVGGFALQADIVSKLHVKSGSTTIIGLIVQGVAGQTADLMQIRDGGGVILDEIDSNGQLAVGGANPNSMLDIRGSLSILRVPTAVSLATDDETLIGVTDTTVARTITIQTTDIVAGRIFIIKDESGAASNPNPITITTQVPATNKIDGVESVKINVAFGVVRLYVGGTNLFSW